MSVRAFFHCVSGADEEGNLYCMDMCIDMCVQACVQAYVQVWTTAPFRNLCVEMSRIGPKHVTAAGLLRLQPLQKSRQPTRRMAKSSILPS